MPTLSAYQQPMKRLFATAVLLTLTAGAAVAEPRILAGYPGGSGNGDYRNALGAYGIGSGGSYSNNGYSGASAPINRQHSGGSVGNVGGVRVGWANALFSRAKTPAAPCGNYLRAPARCHRTTMAWDPSFAAQRGW